MTPARAAALGAVQGVAEIVPVSSSAQLVLLPWLLRWDPPADRTTFASALHAGSCLGICWALRADLRALDLRTAARLAAASAPAAVAGYLAADAVERRLGRPPQLAVLLAGFGVLMWAVDARADRRHQSAVDSVTQQSARDTQGVPSSGRGVSKIAGGGRGPSGITNRQAAVAGLAQVAALVPGVSRSGATLTALRAAGVDRAVAHRFSLLMSLPITAGAAGLSLARADGATTRALAPSLVAGAGTAAVTSAAAATRLRSRPAPSLAGAALYRLGLAAVVARRLIRQGAA